VSLAYEYADQIGEPFATWLKGRFEANQIDPDLSLYSPKDLNELLNVSRRLPNYWEERYKDGHYPTYPGLAQRGLHNVRVYMPHALVDIALWYWLLNDGTDWMSYREVAHALGVTYEDVAQAVQQGKCALFGNNRLTTSEELRVWLGPVIKSVWEGGE
jgi:hypothetical protein